LLPVLLRSPAVANIGASHAHARPAPIQPVGLVWLVGEARLELRIQTRTPVGAHLVVRVVRDVTAVVVLVEGLIVVVGGRPQGRIDVGVEQRAVLRVAEAVDAAIFDFAASIDIDDEGVAMAVDEAENIVAARGDDAVGDGNVGVGNFGVGGGGGRGLPRV
jgi:hypothetical protein